MKVKKFLLLLSCPFLLASCGNNANTDYPDETPDDDYYISQVVEYLDENGSSEYNFVSTGQNTYIGYDYSSEDFIVGIGVTSDSLYVSAVFSFEYSSTVIEGMFQIKDGGTVKFQCLENVTTENHKYSSVQLSTIYINTYPEGAYEYIAELIVMSATDSFNNASSFLKANGLPYIF